MRLLPYQHTEITSNSARTNLKAALQWLKWKKNERRRNKNIHVTTAVKFYQVLHKGTNITKPVRCNKLFVPCANKSCWEYCMNNTKENVIKYSKNAWHVGKDIMKKKKLFIFKLVQKKDFWEFLKLNQLWVLQEPPNANGAVNQFKTFKSMLQNVPNSFNTIEPLKRCNIQNLWQNFRC